MSHSYWQRGLFLIGILIFALDGRGVSAGSSASRRAQTHLILLASLYVLCTFLAHLPYFVAGRYRVPMVPALMLVGSYGLWRIGREFMERRPGRAALEIAGTLAVYLLVSRNPTGYAPDLGKWYFSQALALARKDDLAGARNAYEEVLRLKPDFAPVHVNLGVLQLRSGDFSSAEGSFRKALAIDPGSAVIHYDLGLALASGGKRVEAIAEYENALAINPDFIEVRVTLKNLLKESEPDSINPNLLKNVR